MTRDPTPASESDLEQVIALCRAIIAGKEPHLPVQGVTKALARTVVELWERLGHA